MSRDLLTRAAALLCAATLSAGNLWAADALARHQAGVAQRIAARDAAIHFADSGARRSTPH